jgi:hypothetical protein
VRTSVIAVPLSAQAFRTRRSARSRVKTVMEDRGSSLAGPLDAWPQEVALVALVALVAAGARCRSLDPSTSMIAWPRPRKATSAPAHRKLHQRITAATVGSVHAFQLSPQNTGNFAAQCLAHLWHAHGKNAEAREPLAPAYGVHRRLRHARSEGQRPCSTNSTPDN